MIARRMIIGLLFVGTAVASANSQVPAIDPKSLLGEWAGDVLGPVNLKYSITLDKVDGNQLSGKAKANWGSGSGGYDIAGTLVGNVFTYQSATKHITVELVVEGDTMKGYGERAQGAVGKFALTRQQ
jgi:hypothetical protein